MQDSFSKRKKIRAMIIISLLLLLIYAKNLIERSSFKEISRAFSEVYDDRLVVKGYILDISEKIFTIQELIDHCNIDFDYGNIIKEITRNENEILDIIKGFEQTKLTEQEAIYLSDFKKIILNDLNIKSYELLFSDSSGVNVQQVKLYDAKISQARKDLDGLAEIQLVEGEKLVVKAKSLINKSQIWAQFEVALLVLILIVLYMLLFKNFSSKEATDQ
jgi:hypothetical protein